MAKKWANGVDHYIKGQLAIGFPGDYPSCQYCPLLRKDYDSGNRRCWLTGEWLFYPDSHIGLDCPLEFGE